MTAITSYIKARFTEHSTWYGIILVAISFGLKLSPEQQQAIIYFGMAIAGAPDINFKKVFSPGKADDQVIAKTEYTDVTKEVKHEIKSKSISDIISDDASL